MTRQKFKDYYEKRTKLDPDGSGTRTVYVYTGEYYVLGAVRGTLKRQKIKLAAFAAGAFALYACAGFFNAEGLRAFYILLPFVAAFLPGALLLAGAVRLLLTKKSKLTVFDVTEMYTRTRRCAGAAAALCWTACAGEIALFLLKRRAFTDGADPYVFLLCFSAAALFFFAWKTARAVSCSPLTEPPVS